MNFRSTYVLMGIVAALLVGLAVYVFFIADEKPSGEGYLFGGFRAAGYKPSEIQSLEIEHGDEKLILMREAPGQWKMISPVTARADGVAVESIIQQAMDARFVNKSTQITSNLSTYGLDKPPLKLTLKKGEKGITVSFGKVTLGDPSQSLLYVLTPDSSKPQVLRRASLSSLFKPGAEIGPDTDIASVTRWIGDFRSLRLLGTGLGQEPMLNTVEIRIAKGKKVLDLSRDNPEHVWRFKAPEGYGDAETDSTGPKSDFGKISSVRELLHRVVDIQVSEPKYYIDRPTDLEKMGLDPNQGDVLQIELFLEGGTTETLYLGKQVEGEGDKVYAQYKGDASAAIVNASTPRALGELLKDPVSLRDKNFLKFRPERIDAIDVDIAGTKFELRQIAGLPMSWKVYTSDGSVASASTLAVEAFLKQLSQPNIIQGFPAAGTKDDAMGFDKPAVELKIWEKGIVAAEKADPNAKPKVKEQPSFRVLFGKVSINPSQVFARRWVGESRSDVLIPATLLAAAKKPRREYLESTIKSFNVDQVAKLTFTRGGETWEIGRDEKETKPAAQSEWKFSGPAEMKDKSADAAKVTQILRQLANLKSIEILTDKPTPEQLKTLKLDPARVKVTVKVQNELAERIYYFGEDAGDPKNRIVAKTGDSPMVYEVSRGVFDDTQTGQLQDMVIYRVDPAKLKVLKVKGWRDVVSKVDTREFEKKDDVWILKSDPANPIDSNKVNTFLLDVLTPKAEALIAGGIKPEYYLDPNVKPKSGHSAMEIELDTGDGKPVTLTIGGVTPDGVHIYATSNRAPKEVFTLLKDRFEKVRGAPGVFEKD